MFDLSQVPTAIKWVAGVLVAGFIAQFGKMLAEYLIDRYRKKKREGATAAVPDNGTNPYRAEDQEALQAKALKKELKARQKRDKKKRK